MEIRRPSWSFLRDAIAVALVLGLLLALVRYNVGPAIVRMVGLLLWLPLMFVHVVLGGETEAPFGPSMVLIVIYAAFLGVTAAGLASVVRRRFDVSALSNWRFLVASLLAVAGTIALVVGAISLFGLYGLTTVEAALTLLAGFLSIGGGLALASSGE